MHCRNSLCNDSKNSCRIQWEIEILIQVGLYITVKSHADDNVNNERWKLFDAYGLHDGHYSEDAVAAVGRTHYEDSREWTMLVSKM